MKKRVIALGFFDGVHRGHMALMKKAVERAKELGAVSTVFSFDIHPSQLITGKAPLFIINPDDRESEMKRLSGVDEVIFCNFTKEIMEMDWEDFVGKILVEKYNACHIITGENNRFGYKGRGNSSVLAKFCKENNIGYDCISDVKINGEIVSSSLIRTLIENGEIERANEYLMHPFFVKGVVQHGKKIGRQMGIKTANIEIKSNVCCPKFGVYVAKVIISDKAHIAAVNVGKNPTFSNEIPMIEPHILDFSEEIYGKNIKVEFYKFLRSEIKFENTEHLKKQIEADILNTRNYFR